MELEEMKQAALSEIENEPYTIQEALKALDVPLAVLLRITASKESKHRAALEMIAYLNIASKWAIEHAISTQED